MSQKSNKTKGPKMNLDSDNDDSIIEVDHVPELLRKSRTSMKRKRIKTIESDSGDDAGGGSGIKNGISKNVTGNNENADAEITEIESEGNEYKRKLRPRRPSAASIAKIPSTSSIDLEELDDSSEERDRKPKRQKSFNGVKKTNGHTKPMEKKSKKSSESDKAQGSSSTPKTKPKKLASTSSPKLPLLSTPKSSTNKPSTPTTTPSRRGANKDKKSSTPTTGNTTPKSGHGANKRGSGNGSGVRTIDSYFTKKPVYVDSSESESEEDEEEEDTITDGSTSDVEIIACKKSNRKSKKPNTKKSAREIKKEKERLVEIERQNRLAFLYSGVPDEINKAKKVFDKKKEEEDKLDNMGLFPILTHCGNSMNGQAQSESNDAELCGVFRKLMDHNYFKLSEIDYKVGNLVPSENQETRQEVNLCCKTTFEGVPSALKQFLPNASRNSEDEDSGIRDIAYTSLPWIEKYKAKRRKDLVVDKFALRKFEKWLRQWKSDIDDDGGSSRKIIEKKRKTDSDSDFITDNSEDGEFKKKSVILAGLPGTGKTTIVYTVAQHLGFKVVEVNFSDRRSQRKVLQDVEEATLSRRLAEATTDDNRHCLLLFEDIDQIYEDEDEGFHSAVAQLIAGSLRPIVMTLSKLPPTIVDLRIERKDPLWIPIKFPNTKDIVHKVLIPIIQKEATSQGESIDIDDMDYVIELLESIVRHSLHDIRKCINQAQAIWSERSFSIDTIHKEMQKLNLELEYTTPTENENTHEMTLTEESQDKKQIIENLEETSKYLEILGTFDMHREHSDSEIFSTIETMVTSRLPTKLDTFRNLTFDSESTKTHYSKTRDLYNEIQNNYINSPEDYDDVGYVRTIVKNTLLKHANETALGEGSTSSGSIFGRSRRAGRVRHYLYPIDQELVSKISDSLDFKKQLDIVKTCM